MQTVGLFDFLSRGRKERFRARMLEVRKVFQEVAPAAKCARSDGKVMFHRALQAVAEQFNEPSGLPPNTGYEPSRSYAYLRHREPAEAHDYVLLGVLGHHITVEDRDCCLQVPTYPIVELVTTYDGVTQLLQRHSEIEEDLEEVLASLRASLYGISLLQIADDMDADARASFEAGRSVSGAGWANLSPGNALRRHAETYPDSLHQAMHRLLSPNPVRGDLIDLLEAAFCFLFVEDSPVHCPACALFEGLADAWGGRSPHLSLTEPSQMMTSTCRSLT